MAKFKLLLFFSLFLNTVAIVAYYGAEKSINITSRLINYFGIESLLFCGEDSNLSYHSVNKTMFSIHGVLDKNQVDHKFSRIVLDDIEIRDSLKKQAMNTAGVRVRFRTNSNYLSLRFTGLTRPGYSHPHHSEYGAAGIDIYVNNTYSKTLLASDCGVSVLLADNENNQLRDIELFLPNFSKAKVIDIGLEKGASIEASKKYEKSIIFYGTSITQGSGASRASLSYPAMISRRLNADFYNLGFSGNAQGDREIAEMISNVNTDLVFLEFSRQAKAINGSIGSRLKMFYEVLRNKNPLVPIVVASSFYDSSERTGNIEIENRRKEFYEAYLDLKQNDSNIYFLRGYDLLGEADFDGLTDGTHPNTLGASLIADRVTPFLDRLLHR